MKYLIILLLFCGCKQGATFKVASFESNQYGGCTYTVHQLGNGIREDIWIIDSCNKYQVGDTLTFIKK